MNVGGLLAFGDEWGDSLMFWWSSKHRDARRSAIYCCHELRPHFLRRVRRLGRDGDKRKVDHAADVGEQFIAGLRLSAGVRLVVEFDCADNGEIAGAAHNVVEVFEGDAIDCALPDGRSQSGSDGGDIGDANLPEDAVLRSNGLIENAEEQTLGGGEKRLGRFVWKLDAARVLSLALDVSEDREGHERRDDNEGNQHESKEYGP